MHYQKNSNILRKSLFWLIIFGQANKEIELNINPYLT